jgi:chromosome segregation protein
MYLKSLRIQGFKTFARRTDLPFSSGITAIVGPNGSGKSNLVDAIRWALGERNARGLRGQRMEDVIYSGGPGKSAVGMAEVTLTIDNADQRLNVEFTEIEVARRLFRSGDSEYLINGSRARLKDIDALLASTGLRQDGYAVTAQNDIDYVIQAAPALRRELIEEAAGVRRLRDQRQEALSRLAQAEADMTRAQDLLNELSPRAEELRGQAVAAEEYQRVASQLKTLQGSLARDAWRKAMVQLRRAQSREHSAQSKQAAADQALKEFEPLYSDHRAALLNGREARWNHQQALAELRLRLAEAHHQARIAQERSEAAARALTAAVQELARLSESEKAGSRVVEELKGSVENLSRELDGNDQLVEAARLEEAAHRQTQAQVEAARTALQQRRHDSSRERLSAEAELRQLEGRVVFLQEQRQQFLMELEQWSARHAGLKAGADDCERRLQESERELTQKSGELSKTERGYAEATGALDIAAERVSQASATVQRLEAEAAALRLLRDRAQQDNQTALSGARLLELIEVDEAYRPAVEAALEGSLRAWVALDESTARKAIDTLSSNGHLRETILFTPTQGRRQAIADAGVSLRARITARPEVEPLLDHLLQGFAVVPDLAGGRSLLNRYPELQVVTLKGELLTSFSYRGGHAEESPLKIQAQLRSAEDSLARSRSELEESRHSVAELASNRDRTVQERERAGAELETARAQHAQATAALSAARSAVDLEAQQDLALKNRIARISSLLDQVLDQQAEATQRQTVAVATEAQAEGELPALDNQARGAAAQLAEALSRRQETEIRAALARQRHDDLIRQLERASQVVRSHGDELAQRQAATQELEAQPAAVEAERRKCLDQANGLAEELALLQTQELPDAASLERLESQLREDEQLNVSLQVELAHTQDAAATATLEVENAQAEVDRCALALGEDGQAIEEEEPAAEVDWQKTEREVARLQRRLDSMGAVNLLAPDEYRELSERCQSLTTQLADLQAASAQLVELRQRLEQEIDDRFRTVFQSVAVNFQEFFGELFEGGRATLRLEGIGEGNPLDEGVEILAQTPGKRLQPLSLLSGGERALTALAFLFALQAVNPSPFYVLDEVDAALDDANVVRFNRVLKRLAEDQQFLIVTHNHSTMAQAQALYGVTLGEHGISRMVSVRLEQETSIPRLRERTA